MGTDAHLFFEVSHDGEPWHAMQLIPDPIKIERDYVLFSYLADVRNRTGRGFRTYREPEPRELDGKFIMTPGWWYDTDDGNHSTITPVSVPRGVPMDASERWQDFCAEWIARTFGRDLHMSHLTMDEILGGDLDQLVREEGVISEDAYIAWQKDGTPPDQVAAGAAGDGVRTVTMQEYAAGERGERETFVSYVGHPVPLRERLAEFIEVAEGIESRRPPTSRLRLMLLFES